MRTLSTPEEMRAFDAAAAGRCGIPGSVLMENAGRGVVDRIVASLGSPAGKKVVVVCGKGNNGGDGFVIARHLLMRGASVDVLLLARTAAVRGDARIHLDILLKLRKTAGDTLRFSSQASRFVPPVTHTDIVVDAIFGTGFSGTPRGIAAAAIRWINGCGATVIAVDIPSGLDGATGLVAGEAVRAALTVTMAAEKVGQYVGAGPDHCGRVEIVDIGITPQLVAGPAGRTFRADDASIAALLPQRPRRVHKYAAGKVLVLGGSRQYAGAPVLAALAALRAGAGAVVLGVPVSLRPVIASRTGDIVLQALAENERGTIGMEALGQINERIGWADAVVIGPGLGRDPETDALVREIFATCAAPLVVDADALTALRGRSSRLWKRPGPTILTPHAGELGSLLDQPAGDVDTARVTVACDSAKRFHGIVVLKGASTVCAHPDGRSFVNTTGNPGMATIGTGDVLAGVIGALLAQRVGPMESAAAGVYLHGRAGDLAAQRFGERSLLASDLLATLPAAFLSVERP